MPAKIRPAGRRPSRRPSRRPRRRPRRRAFTAIELMVAIGAISLLIGLLLPAVGEARQQAKLTVSLSNLRNLAVAHATYAAEWNDRQWTLVPDALSAHGRNAATAWPAFRDEGGVRQPDQFDVVLGHVVVDGERVARGFRVFGDGARPRALEPIVFDRPRGDPDHAFGAFRLINVNSFNEYVTGRFYDHIFYAPDDRRSLDRLGEILEHPDGFVDRRATDGSDLPPVWSSYILSPAAQFNPKVMESRRRGADGAAGGWTDPWSFASGFRSPALGQTRYPSLKTHMIEHDWLRGDRSGCHPGAGALTEGESCFPYRFNAAADGEPATLWMDGHVSTVPVRQAWKDDQRMRAQRPGGSGLWLRSTPFGEDGYFNDLRIVDPDGEDGTSGDCPTSFHVLTADGILGRDVLAN